MLPGRSKLEICRKRCNERDARVGSRSERLSFRRRLLQRIPDQIRLIEKRFRIVELAHAVREINGDGPVTQEIPSDVVR